MINRNYSLYLGINNLFNFIQTASLLLGYDDPKFEPGFSPCFDTAYAYAPNHGIEFYLGFKWDLAKKINYEFGFRKISQCETKKNLKNCHFF